ncbi:MAG TPA: hypothetical protein VFJ16_31305 [Longimicrobium sp.]|nr:hypothetical protein [Longimicrobium sp.]
MSDLESVAAEVRALKDLIARMLSAPQEIYPNRLYKPVDAARLLGIDSVRGVMTIGQIPDLPKVRIGPNGGLVRYRGSDLLQLMNARTERR